MQRFYTPRMELQLPGSCAVIAAIMRMPIACFDPFAGLARQILDAIQAMPFPAMQSLLGPAFPDGNHNYWKSTLQAEFSDEAISIVVEHGNRMRSPLSALVIEYYGGAAGRVAGDATAFPYRHLPWDVLMVAQWTDPSESSLHRQWARDGEDALRPFAGGGHLLSALDADDTASTAFGPNLSRLSAIKAKYDPDNFFHVNQNIKPSLAQSV